MQFDPVHTIAAVVGFASMLLLWLALILGLALARGWVMTTVRHTTMLAIHGSIAVMGLTLGVVHAFAQLAPADRFVYLIGVLVPFANPVDRWGIGFGVVALEVMIALAISMTVQKRLGFHRWRALHATSYAAYTAATAHILVSGAETGLWWVTALVLAPWLVVVGLWMTGSARADDAPAIVEKITTRSRPSTTTVQVDPIHCVRFGFCEQEAPEIFKLRSDGQLAFHTVVADQHADAAARAVRACPARAISLSQGSPSAGGGTRRFASQTNGRG